MMMSNAITLIESGTAGPTATSSRDGSQSNQRGGLEDVSLPSLHGLQPRYGATGWASASSREILFWFGGCDATGSPTATLQRCNVVTTEVKIISFQKGPSARYLHATAVDPRSATGDDTFTYGGSGTAMLLDDLWCWDGAKCLWKEMLSIGCSPGRRHSHQISCSSCGSAVIVVGGSTAPPPLAYQHDSHLANPPPAAPVGETSSGSHPLSEEGGAWVYNIATETWTSITVSPQLRGRRLFSMVRLGRKGGSLEIVNSGASVRSARQPSVVVDPNTAMFPMTTQSGGGVGRSSSVGSGVFGSFGSVPSIDTFMCSPGTRQTDVPVILRLIGGSAITEAHLQCPAESAELSHDDTHGDQPPLTHSDETKFQAVIQPPPSRRAGSIFVHYSLADDEPVSVVESMATAAPLSFSSYPASLRDVDGSPISTNGYTALDEVSIIRFGGTFEGDLSMLSRAVRSSPGTMSGARKRVEHCSVIQQLVVPHRTDAEQDCLDAHLQSSIDAAEDAVDDSSRGQGGGRANSEMPSQPPLAPPRQCHELPSRTDVVMCTSPEKKTEEELLSSDALLRRLCHISNAAVIHTAGATFVFGGRSEFDGRVSAALFLVQKKGLLSQLREERTRKSDDGASMQNRQSPVGRRQSTRLQAIMATMGSMRRRSFASADRKKAKGLQEDCKESVLQRYERLAKEQSEAQRRRLVQELVQVLLETGDLPPSQQKAAEDTLLERMHATGDGALTWDLHEHYHDLVEQLLRPIGMASPIIGDEGVVASETAFYLRQSVARHKYIDDEKHTALHISAAKPSRGYGQPHRLKDDAAISTQGRRYHEWYHPPIVSRSQKVALERLAQPSSLSARAPRRPPSSTVEKCVVPAPLASAMTAHRRQIRTELHRQEQSLVQSARPSSRPTPSFSPRPGTPASIFAQKHVTPEAIMAVNAPSIHRRPHSSSHRK